MQVVGDEDGWRQLPSIRDVQCEPGMDEERALLRTAELVEREGHIVPAGWPRDVIRCAVCDEMHPRELCCQSETSTRGETHCGELELITWNMDDDNYRVDLDIDNADSAVARALESCGREYGRVFDERPDAFRWTCCGARGSETSYGCHHHHHVYWRREGSTCKCEECRKDRPKKSMNMYCEDTFRFGIALETRMLTGVGFFSKNIWNSIEGMRWAYTQTQTHPYLYGPGPVCFFINTGAFTDGDEPITCARHRKRARRWTRRAHRHFPSTFKTAVRTLLLVGAAHREKAIGVVLGSTDLQNVLFAELARRYIDSYKSRVPMDDILKFCALDKHMTRW